VNVRQDLWVTSFLDPALLPSTLGAADKWRFLFAELGTFASGITFRHEPTAFGGEGADIATIMVGGVEIEAAEWQPDDIRFSAIYPDGRALFGEETFFPETDGRGGLFGLRRIAEPDVEARSALNTLVILTTMKALADAVTETSWEELRNSGGVDTPIGRLSGFSVE
jgi:hypothetical protein